MTGLTTLIAIGLLGSISQEARADTIEDELEQLVEYAPDPWERSPLGPYVIATPAALGFDDTGVFVPGRQPYDVVYGQAGMDELRSHISLQIVPGFDTLADRDQQPYLIAPPNRINGFIAEGQAGGIWSFEETDLVFPYEGRPDGLRGYGAVRVHIFNADRTTQCIGLRETRDNSDPGAYEYYTNRPSIACQITRYAPDHQIRISVPAQFAMQLGDIVTRVERDAEAIAAAAGLSGGEN